MTREEAIKIIQIKQIPQCGDREITLDEEYQAFEMAISALEQPTVCDIEQIRAEIDSYCSDNRDRNDGLYVAMRIIDKHTKGAQE